MGSVHVRYYHITSSTKNQAVIARKTQKIQAASLYLIGSMGKNPKDTCPEKNQITIPKRHLF
jgi:hypothetical protein